MISSQEAQDIIQSHVIDYGTEKIPIETSAGRILAEPLYADRDFPPFDRVCMDGIAIRFSAYANGVKSFQIQETQLAGEKVTTLKEEKHCIEIMTGAVLPIGTDTVIPFEHIEKMGDAYQLKEEVKEAKNIHYQGTDSAVKSLLLHENRVIGPKEIAVLATIGCATVLVKKKPNIAVISTGDELIPVDQNPEAHQIRMSNSHMLRTQLIKLGWDANIHHLPDHKDTLRLKLSELLETNDILIFSGGVSRGKADFVPEILEELNVKKLFHRIKQRPGKPFWFGKQAKKLIFAFPGNPVSSFVCFLKYFKPWFYKTQAIWVPEIKAELAEPFSFKPGLTYFLQVATTAVNGKIIAAPVEGNGSGDLANLLYANGLLELPADQTQFKKGELFPYIEF